jgi:peptide deformylase
MPVREILILGNPRLYEKSPPVEFEELDDLKPMIDDLHDTLFDFRNRTGAGRAIAAPQIGVMKRLIYMHIDRPTVFINPGIVDKSNEMMTVWDDCMSFPDLLVRVKRHQACSIRYFDQNWQAQQMLLEDDLSELLQHEYDHLDGILAVSRALDSHSFAFKSQTQYLSGG